MVSIRWYLGGLLKGSWGVLVMACWKNRPLYPKLDHCWFKVAHNYEPLALQVVSNIGLIGLPWLRFPKLRWPMSSWQRSLRNRGPPDQPWLRVPEGRPALGPPGSPTEPQIIAQYPKIESVRSIGSAILEVQACLCSPGNVVTYLLYPKSIVPTAAEVSSDPLNEDFIGKVQHTLFVRPSL